MGQRLGFREPKSGCIPIRLPHSHNSGATREVAVARRLAKEIGQDIEQLRWLWWQTVRRCPKYRREVATLLKRWRKSCYQILQPGTVMRLKAGGYTLREEFFHKNARVRAARAALAGYRQLRALPSLDLPPNSGARKRREKYFLAATELMSVVDRALRSRYYSTPERSRKRLPVLALLNFKRKKQDALPELKVFYRRWGLKFPIPPRVELPPEELMTSAWCHPVRILRSDRHCLILILHLAAGREMILSFIEGALHHSNPLRKRGRKMAWRMVSRKRHVKRDVRVVRFGKDRLKVTIALPAHAQDVKTTVRDWLPRAAASWRGRDDYESVFRVIDSLQKGPPWLEKYTDGIKVRDSKRSFKSLVRKFGLPR